MAIRDVAEQLQEHCPCFADTDLEELDKVAEEVVNLISVSACWTRSACETLLRSLRQERVEIPCLGDACNENTYYRFRPYYQFGIVTDSLVVTAISQQGLTTSRIVLSEDEFAVTDINGYYEFIIDINNYARRCKCDLTELVVLEFEYESGYDALPSCLFPQVCDLVSAITASKLGCGSLDDCCSMNQRDLGYALKSKKKGELSWSWSKDTDSIEYLYSQLVASNRFKALGLISLCGTDEIDYKDNLFVGMGYACKGAK